MDHRSAPVTAPALELRGITKRYPGVTACDAVDFRVEASSVHALVGENGAGKSTLMQIASGLVAQDAGTVHIGGVLLGRRGPAGARALGLGMVHQHFLLVPTLSVADNVVLGREPGRLGVYDRAAAEARVRATALQHGFDLDPRLAVGDLSVGEQQRVEIVRVLDSGARVIILDEPTAVLVPQETADLMRILRDLAAAGHAIVFISHRLPEVRAVADTITVLRAGRAVETLAARDATEAGLARAIVGRALAAPVVSRAHAPGGAVLELADIHTAGTRGALHGVSLAVRAGEIVAVAGVEGNGQQALLRSVLGLDTPQSGRILFAGRDVTRAGVAERRRRGMAYVSDDRLGEGLVPDMTLAENLLLSVPQADALGWRGFLRPAAWRARAAALLGGAEVRPALPDRAARTLSGGNQQKVVLGRELAGAPQLLVLGQPTRGVDVGGIEFLHARIRSARDAGTAVLLVSADLAEIRALADRVVVLYGGQLRGPIAIDAATPERLGRLMLGAEDMA